MKFFILAVVLMGSLTALADETYLNGEEEVFTEEGILHEMFLACVSTKRECTVMAKKEGFNTSKTVKDGARCPSAPKILACIVKH